MDSLQKQTAEIISDVQALSHELHPPRLLLLGVVAAMRGFCREISGQKNAEVVFRSEKVPRSVPNDTSLCLFRVLQEALHNAVRHSRVSQFDVHLRGNGDTVCLTVRDEGVGFDVDAASRGMGLGLTSMKERLKLVGGELSIESHLTRAPPCWPARLFGEARARLSVVAAMELWSQICLGKRRSDIPPDLRAFGNLIG